MLGVLILDEVGGEVDRVGVLRRCCHSRPGWLVTRGRVAPEATDGANMPLPHRWPWCGTLPQHLSYLILRTIKCHTYRQLSE
jgi:hypothetical protein